MVGGSRAAAAGRHPAGPRPGGGGGRRLCRALGRADPAAAGPAGGGAGCGTHRLGRLLPQWRHGLGRAEGGGRGAGEGLRRGAGQGHHLHRRGQPALHRGDDRPRGDRLRLCPLRPLLGRLVARPLRGHGAAGRLLAEITGLPTSMLPRERQHEALGSDHYHGGMLVAATGSLHPGKYARGLAAAAERAGARLVDGVRVQGITGRPGRLPHRHRPRRDHGRRGAGHHQRLFARYARHRLALAGPPAGAAEQLHHRHGGTGRGR